MSFVEVPPTVSADRSWATFRTSRTASRRRLAGRLAVTMVLVDLFAVGFGFLLAVVLADATRGLLGVDGIDALVFLGARIHQLALLAALTICIFAFGGLYRRSGWELGEIRMIVAGIGLLALFDTALQFMLHDHHSRIWSFMAYPLVALSVISFRMILRSVPAMAEAMTSNVILIGAGIDPGRLVYEMRESRSGPVRLLRSLSIADVAGLDALALERKLLRIAHAADVPSHRIQAVLAPAAEEIGAVDGITGSLNASQRPYSIVLPFAGLARNGLGLQKVIGADMVMAEARPATAPGPMRVLKRIFDIVCASLAIILLLPLLVFIGVRLALEKGPVFFSQLRVGRDGQRFRCFKFRTMRPDAQERLEELLATDPAARAEWEKYQKLQDDPRITPIGHFLRKTSLDELPQLFNVLTGDMSIVGPRPIIAPEIEGYPGDQAYYDHPDFAYYLLCTPGITGLWQVSGRSETSHDERVRLDRWYARNMSFWLDVIILFKTFRTVLVRHGSA